MRLWDQGLCVFVSWTVGSQASGLEVPSLKLNLVPVHVAGITCQDLLSYAICLRPEFLKPCAGF